MESEEEEKYCTNCKRSVAAKNFAIHSAYCERNIFVCKICKEPVSISEKDEHFENYHVIAPCNLCEASIERWMLPDHMEICPKRLIACQYCEAEFHLTEHAEHVEFCGSRTEKCLICQKYVMMKHKDKHTELHKCEQKYQRKKIDEEVKQNKVNEVMSILESSNVKKSNSEDFPKREENRKGDPKTRIGANFEGMKESAFDKTSPDLERREQDLRMQSLQGATALPDRAKEKSSRYGVCHICEQSIPWIDMNTHIPSCASLAGKCSLCGEDVPNHQMKDHMRGHMSGQFRMQSIRVPPKVSYEKCEFCDESVPNYAMKDHMNEHLSDNFQTQSVRASESPVSYTRKNSSDHDRNDDLKVTPHHKGKHSGGTKSSLIIEYECPLCLKMIPRRDKNRHEAVDCETLQDSSKFDSTYFSRSVSQNFHECDMCSEKVPEEKWQSHTSFGCKMLLQRGHSDTSNMESDSPHQYECPYCLSWMQEKDIKRHELFECKTLIACSGVNIPEPKSYANSVQKTCQCSCRKKTINCWKCKINPQQGKVTCCHCKEKVEMSTKGEHEKYCSSSKSYKDTSKLKTQDDQSFKVVSHKQKGAVPKKTNIREMMRPEIGKCKYCNTSLNVDIVKYHEDECIHQPVDCPECQGKIPLKDLDSHECKKKKKKDMKKNKGEPQVPEEKTESGLGFKKLFKYVFNTSNNEEKDEKQNMSWQHSNPYNYHQNYPHYSEGSQPFDFELVMVPCEFCNKEIPASELVLHETGCQPDLVSHAKQGQSGSPILIESSAKSDKVRSNKEMNESSIRFNRSNMGGMEQPFFSGNSSLSSDRKKHERKSDTKPGEFLQFNCEKSLSRNYEETRNKSKGKKENSSFQSVWNSDMYTDTAIESQPEEISKQVDDPVDVDKLDDPNPINARTTKQESRLMRRTSEDDMNAYLLFLDDSKNNKFEKDSEIVSEVGEKRAEFISSKYASYSTFDSVLKEQELQKSHEERNTNIDGESARLFKEATRSVAHSSNNGIEMRTAIQQLKDLHLDGYKSAATSYKQISVEANLLEKKDFEPEISSKQEFWLDASVKRNRESNDDFKKYLPDLNFASPKEKSSNSSGGDKNDGLCAKEDERHEKLFEKQLIKTSECDRLNPKEECADSLKNQIDLNFSMYQTSVSSDENFFYETKAYEELKNQSQENISIRANSSGGSGDYMNGFKNQIPDSKFTTYEKLDIIGEYNRLISEEYEEAHKDCSKHFQTVKDDKTLTSSSNNLTDSAHLMSNRCSLKNTTHETVLQKSEVDEPPMSGIKNKSRNIAGENECISNYKKYFPDFKFAASETVSNEDSAHSLTSKKNLGAIEKRPKQQLQKASNHYDCSEIGRENPSSFNSLANLKYASNKPTAFLSYSKTHQRNPCEKDDEPEKLHLDKTSCIDKMSKSEVEYSNDFRKYLPDFKFGPQLTRSLQDKTCIPNLSDKEGQVEENALKQQAAQLTLNESVDVLGDLTRKKIKDLETRIANMKKQSQDIVEHVNEAKWKQWRGTSNSSSSDTE